MAENTLWAAKHSKVAMWAHNLHTGDLYNSCDSPDLCVTTVAHYLKQTYGNMYSGMHLSMYEGDVTAYVQGTVQKVQLGPLSAQNSSEPILGSVGNDPANYVLDMQNMKKITGVNEYLFYSAVMREIGDAYEESYSMFRMTLQEQYDYLLWIRKTTASTYLF